MNSLVFVANQDVTEKDSQGKTAPEMVPEPRKPFQYQTMLKSASVGVILTNPHFHPECL